MAQLKVHGKAIIRDSRGTVTFAGSGTVINEDADYTKDFAEEPIEDNDGRLATILTKRMIEKLTINVIPIGDTFSQAIGSADLPTENEVVTLADWTITGWNGQWNFKSGGKQKVKKGGVAMMTWNLERYDGAALTEVTS